MKKIIGWAVVVIITLFLLTLQADYAGTGCGYTTEVEGPNYIDVGYGPVLSDKPQYISTGGFCSVIHYGWPIEVATYSEDLTPAGKTTDSSIKPLYILIPGILLDAAVLALPITLWVNRRKLVSKKFA